MNATGSITFDDDRIFLMLDGGDTRTVYWKDLTMVGIRTTDDGPWEQDVFWGLHTGDESPALVYPQDIEGADALFSALQSRLPGFDNEQVIAAMGSTDNAFFKIWESGSMAGAPSS